MGKIFATSGYGCGNLGDEAIFNGVLKTYPDVIQVYSNLPSYYKNVWYADIIEKGFPTDAAGGELIIGGGGILYSDRSTDDLLSIAKRAMENDMKISIRKVGLEYLTPERVEKAKELFYLSYFISVRSKKSAEMLEEIGVKNYEVERDYAYDLKDEPQKEVFKISFFKNKIPIIGLVTAGNKDDLNKISTVIKFILSDVGLGDTRCNVLFIPHTRHYVDFTTNDVVTGEMLWSMIDIYHDKRYERFKILPFLDSCYQLLNVYTQLSGIIGMRFHSYVFSEMARIPLLGLISGLKAQSYFDETKRSDCDSMDVGLPIYDILGKVWKFIRFVKDGRFPAETWEKVISRESIREVGLDV